MYSSCFFAPKGRLLVVQAPRAHAFAAQVPGARSLPAHAPKGRAFVVHAPRKRILSCMRQGLARSHCSCAKGGRFRRAHAKDAHTRRACSKETRPCRACDKASRVRCLCAIERTLVVHAPKTPAHIAFFINYYNSRQSMHFFLAHACSPCSKSVHSSCMRKDARARTACAKGARTRHACACAKKVH